MATTTTTAAATVVVISTIRTVTTIREATATTIATTGITTTVIITIATGTTTKATIVETIKVETIKTTITTIQTGWDPMTLVLFMVVHTHGGTASQMPSETTLGTRIQSTTTIVTVTTIPDESFDPEGPESFFSHVQELEPGYYTDVPRTTTPPQLESNESDDDNEIEINDNNNINSHDLIPTTLATATQINNKLGKYWFKSLLDHGGSHVMIEQRCIPKDIELFEQPNMQFKTTAGKMTTTKFIYLSDLRLPEFSYTRRVKKVKCYVFEAPEVEYDIIFGRSFLNQVQIDVLSSQMKCTWFKDEIPFHPVDYFRNNASIRAVMEVPPFRLSQNETHLLETISTKIDDLKQLAQQQTHLNPQQREELHDVLVKHKQLFDGTLGCYPKRKFAIELKPDTIPYLLDFGLRYTILNG